MTKQARVAKAAVERGVPIKAKKINGGRVVNFLFERSQRKRAVLSRNEREQFIIEYRQKARKLGRSILRKWHSRLDLNEVDSIVDLSLCEAVRRFNPYVGATFMTFLYYHLKGNLVRAVSSAASANLVPFNEFEIESMRGGAQYQPNAVEVAEALSSDDTLLPDEAIFRREVAQVREQACAKLDKLEREVIERIYLQGQQLMDIAQSLGYSRCHISRVKKKALQTLCREMAGVLDKDLSTLALNDESEEAKKSARRVVHRRRPRSRITAQQQGERAFAMVAA